jgi:hypothetical protein
MPAMSDPSSSAGNGIRRNLFVKPGREYDALTSPPAGSLAVIDPSTGRSPRRGRGLVTPQVQERSQL